MERLIEERLIVASALIFSVGYSARRSDLEVQFQDGSLWRFLAVPASVYLDFMNAQAKDEFFRDKIKDQYVFRRLEQS